MKDNEHVNEALITLSEMAATQDKVEFLRLLHSKGVPMKGAINLKLDTDNYSFMCSDDYETRSISYKWKKLDEN